MMSERGFASTIAPLGTTREALLMLGRLKVPAKVIDRAAELEYTRGRGSISLRFWFQVVYLLVVDVSCSSQTEPRRAR
jgi:hypothetical protein